MVARSPSAIEAKRQRDRDRMNERNAQRRLNGLCVKCGEPAKPGRANCQKCTDSEGQRLTQYRRLLKARAVEYLSGQCIDCGLRSEYPEVYDFHHRDASEKDIEISRLTIHTKSWKKIQVELEKCDLLCANCHRIRHAKEDRQLPP